MQDKTFHLLVAAVFLVVGALHALRAFMGWPVEVADATVPVWMSWVAVAISAYMVYRGGKLGKLYR